MSIEKDISQRKFNTEFQKAMVNLIYTHNWMMERMKLFFEKADLTPGEKKVLKRLAQEFKREAIRASVRMERRGNKT